MNSRFPPARWARSPATRTATSPPPLPPAARPGRVGDSPLIGCGAYADDECGAASSTGWGESLMKIVFCKSACDLMAAGHPAQSAAEAIIKRLTERVDGLGGIILVDKQGNIGHAFNTPRMAMAWVTPDRDIESAV